MAKLKRVLAGALSLCMVGSMLTACGDSSSSSDSKSSSKKDSSAAASSSADSSSADSSTADSSKAESKEVKSADDDKKIVIHCWNTEFKERLDKYYPNNGKYEVETEEYEKKNDDGSTTKLTQIKKLNGKEVVWVQNANEGSNYQDKLDEALRANASASADEKVDMFLIEADYAMKYINGGVTTPVTDLGIGDDDLKDQYKYTQDVATDTDGNLNGVSWQATPGCFMYNAVYAKEVLGTDEPDKVQEFVKDWDTFKDTAAKMKDKGIAMLAGFDDAYRVFSNNASAPWVTDEKVQIDPQLKAWAEQTKEFTDKGYNNKSSLWSPEWAACQKIDGKTFGFFFSTWGIAFTLKGNTGAEGNGKWRACAGPQSYFWGGTWMCATKDINSQAEVADIMRTITCNKDVMKKITEGEQDYTNNKAAIKEIVDGGYKFDFLGGQNHIALLADQADKIDLTGKLTAYDQDCNEKFQAAMKDWFLGNTKSYDDAVAAFKTEVTKKNANLKFD